MSQFPVWSRRYEAVSRPRTLYTVPGTNSNSGLFRWSALRDPEGIRSMTAGQVFAKSCSADDAVGLSLFPLSRGKAVSPIQRPAAGGENDPPGPVVIRHDMAWECRRPTARAKGQGHQGFPAPLDSPTFPLDATPFGRASKNEGLTGASGAPRAHPDRSGAFRSRTLPLCTVWPRTVMRGGLRKGNSGHYSHI